MSPAYPPAVLSSCANSVLYLRGLLLVTFARISSPPLEMRYRVYKKFIDEMPKKIYVGAKFFLRKTLGEL